MFDVNSLVLERLVYEVRFERGYLYWDNCGKIWNELVAKFPELEMATVSPQEAKFNYKEENIDVSFSANQISINQLYPSNLKLYTKIADEVFNVIISSLKIETLTRIGNRFFYLLKVGSSEESIDIINKIGCFNDISKRISNYGDKIINPNLKFTITKGDEKGYIVNINHLERNLDVSLPKIIKYDTSKFLSKALQLDIDFHTLKPVDCSIVTSSELVKKNERDIKQLINDLLR